MAQEYQWGLFPGEVLGNLECTMVAGRGAASDAAVVVLPSGSGARFSVIGDQGQVVGGALPFTPHHLQLGMREGGVPVVGFGDLRLNSKTFRPMDSPEPVRIYLGEQVVYESDKAWYFLVASDGAYFAVHEPLADGASRLLVRNLETGTEKHFDLGERMTPHNAYELSYAMDYTVEGSEVVFRPAHADAQGIGTYWFYPVGDGAARHYGR